MSDLLEHLERPDNLVQFQVVKEIKFNLEHKNKLAEVENAINPDVVPVTDSAADPILLTVETSERAMELAQTGDADFNKIVTVLAALCDEMAFLKSTAEARFFAPLALFGHSKDDDASAYTDGVLEAMLGLAMPLFQEAGNFCGRVNAVVLNAMQQFVALYGRESRFAPGWGAVRLKPLLLALGDLLAAVITMDALVRDNKLIGAAWEKYKRVADVISGDPAKYGVDPAAAAAFPQLVHGLDRSVMAGQMLRSCLNQSYDLAMAQAGGGGGAAAWAALHDGAIELIDELVARLGSEDELAEAQQVVGQFAVYALFRSATLRSAPDKKVFDRLWRTQERLPMVVLWGKAVWTADMFLVEYAPIPDVTLSRLSPKDPRASRAKAADTLTESLAGFAAGLYGQTVTWLLRAHMAFADAVLPRDPNAVLDIMTARSKLLHKGVSIAGVCSRLVSQFLAYQLHLQLPFKKRCIEPLARLLELTKVIEAGLKRYSAPSAEAVPHVQRELVRSVLEAVMPIRLKVTTVKRADPSLHVIAAATELVESMVLSSESWNAGRRTLLRLGVAACAQKAGLGAPHEPAVVAVEDRLRDLALLADFQQLARRACDCSVVYWVREITPALIGVACSIEGNAPGDLDCRQGARLQYVLTALSDPAIMLAAVVHVPPPPPASQRLAIAAGSEAAKPAVPPESAFARVEHPLTAYETLLHGILRVDVIDPLCRAIDNDLRVQVHAVHLAHMEPPSLRAAGRPPLVHLLQLPPLRVLSALVHLRDEVTHSLERNFYELTTVALHDWKTYGEMSAVALDKYGLVLTDNHLPMGCLDQGLDVLQIMRNIDVFVRRYNYNLNQQFFVEKKSIAGAKHINTVSIFSISGSIRQHGSGMMNTTVNFVYQYLSQRFQLFSQFLHDDYIKSHLAKERRFFRAEKDALDNKYPYPRAEAFTKEIRKLGTTAGKLSYLDELRKLVSEIGNALGYVRMVRSAGMHAASEAVKFVPDIANLTNFEAAVRAVHAAPPAPAEGEDDAAAAAPAEAAGLSQDTIDAAATLDAVLANLTASFAEGVDYFQLLVSVFQHSLLGGAKAATAGGAAPAADGAAAGGAKKKREKEDSHLRNFVLVVPALTISFVENLRAAKDRMDKSVKGAETFFTDDGFAIGLAYILAILRQERLWESMHWWDAVIAHHRAELTSCRDELGKMTHGGKVVPRSKAEADRIEELDFKQRRVHAMQAEFDALFFAFSGARTFFRAADADGAGAGDEDETVLV